MQRSFGNLLLARRSRPTGRMMGVLLLAFTCLAEVRAAPGPVPSTLLLHAQLAQAMAFATQTARQRGWTVVDSGPASVTFEQPLSPDPDGSVALLRITAIGAESPGGVTVSLAALEVRPAKGTAEDVTQRYRENLLNALDSLATKWGLGPAAHAAPAPQASVAPPPTPTPPISTPPIPAPTPKLVQPEPVATPAAPLGPIADPAATPATPRHVGTWAYYAERHAQARGCTLGDRGAVLDERAGGAELHRVYCADGQQVLVRCIAGSCADAR